MTPAGANECGEPVLLRVKNFMPECYVELPSTGEFEGHDWKNDWIPLFNNLKKEVNSAIRRLRGSTSNLGESMKGELKDMGTLYFCASKNDKGLPFIEVRCPSDSHQRALQNVCSSTARGDDKGNTGLSFVDSTNKGRRAVLNLWSGSTIPTTVKLLVTKGIEHTSWLEVPEEALVPKKSRISRLDKEMSISWDKLTPSTADIDKFTVRPLVYGWDIETFHPDYEKLESMPNRNLITHEITNINAMVYYDGPDDTAGGKATFVAKSERKGRMNFVDMVSFVIGDTSSDALEYGSRVVRCRDEKELLTRFVKHVTDSDTEILTGYNLSYDYGYLDARLHKRGVEWPNRASRLIGYSPVFDRTKTIKVSPTVTRQLNEIIFDGRITLDVYHMALREYGWLPQHKLDTVARKIVKRGKHDVKPSYMFWTHARHKKATENLGRIVKGWSPMGDREAIFCGHWGFWPEFHDNVSQEVIDKVLLEYDESVGQKDKVNAYCEEDVMLCGDISDETGMIPSILEQANVYGVQPDEVYTRGEQMRGLAKAYRAARSLGIVIDRRDIPDVGLAGGGHVGRGIPGLTKNVMTLDFKSMYPSIMMALNICYSTYVKPENEKNFSEDDLNIIEWEQLEFTKSGKKKTKKAVLDKNGKQVVRKHRHCFVKPHVKRGILPELVRFDVTERNKIKKMMAKAKSIIMKRTLNIRQGAYKVSGNSKYGLMGTGEFGKLPFKIGSMCVAAKGRELIQLCNWIIVHVYGGEIIYNDTDSTMFTLPGATDGEGMVRLGRKLEREISAMMQVKVTSKDAADACAKEVESIGGLVVQKTEEYVMFNLPQEEIGEWSPEITEEVVMKWSPEVAKGIIETLELFPDPLYFEFEKCGVFYFLTPKKYIYWLLDIDPRSKTFCQLLPLSDINSFLVKGNAAVRRDTCDYTKDIYWKVLISAFEGATLQKQLKDVAEHMLKLLRKQVPIKKLVYTMAIGHYEDQNAVGAVFSRRLPKLGISASAGDRVPYIVSAPRGKGEEDLKKGSLMYPPSAFPDRKGTEDEIEPNAHYYMGRIANPVDQLLMAAYRDEISEMEAKDLRNAYTNMLSWIGGKIEAKRANPRCRKIIEPDVSGCGGNDEKAYLVYLANKTTKTIANEARKAFFSGRGEETRRRVSSRFSSNPLGNFKVQSENGYAKEALCTLCGEEAGNGIFEADEKIGDWNISSSEDIMTP